MSDYDESDDVVEDVPEDIVEDVPVKEDGDEKEEDKEDEEKEGDEEETDAPEQEASPVVITEAPSRMIPPELRCTFPVLTKYERARIVGMRARLIDEGAPLLIDRPEGVTDPVQLAILELKAKRSASVIRRTFSDGSYEDWRVEEMQVIL